MCPCIGEHVSLDDIGIDGPVVKRLANGTIRLLCVSWLVQGANEANQATGMTMIQRFQVSKCSSRVGRGWSRLESRLVYWLTARLTD